jgi:zinc transport system ATP-binding protein
MSVKPIIQATDLFFERQGQTVIDRFSFSIHKGEFVAVIGPNGGGKTTLLKLMMGLIEPSEGVIRLLGENPRSRHVRKNFGYVAQRGGNIDPLFPATVEEVVRSGLHRPSKKDLQEMLSLLGIAHLVNRPLSQLSGGERQRALIARALLSEPKILFLDEPTDGLDPETRQTFFDLLLTLKKTKTLTIIMVSHDVHTIAKYADAALCLKHDHICHGADECYLKGKELRNVVHEHSDIHKHHKD